MKKRRDDLCYYLAFLERTYLMTFFGGFPFYDDRDFRRAEKKLYGKNAGHLMKTDIRETDEGYEIVIDLPGFKKKK